MNVLHVRDLAFDYGHLRVLRDINLRVSDGAFLGVVGPNGAGKSTLLRLLAGVLTASQGTVWLGSTNLATVGPRWIARRISFVPQESHFAYDYTILDVLLMSRNPYLAGFEQPGRADVEIVRRAAEFVGLSTSLTRGINEISGGEKQLVVLARAIAQETPLLLLDEPTVHLDLQHLQTVASVLRRLHGRGKTVVLVTHDLNFAAEICASVVMLSGGVIRASGDPECVLRQDVIADVYRVRPIVTVHPESGRPHILMSTGDLHLGIGRRD